jgi:hypothetical protein
MFKLYDKSNAMARVTIKGRRALHYDGLHLGDCDDRVSYEWHDSFYVAGRSKKAGPRILPTAHIPGLHYTGALYPDDPLHGEPRPPQRERRGAMGEIADMIEDGTLCQVFRRVK